jgi:uncharacterized tellurite resistance protein B-like protein
MKGGSPGGRPGTPPPQNETATRAYAETVVKLCSDLELVSSLAMAERVLSALKSANTITKDYPQFCFNLREDIDQRRHHGGAGSLHRMAHADRSSATVRAGTAALIRSSRSPP